jgi:uncharacterized low-complexity protein
MRSLLSLFLLASALAVSTAAQAENRTFIIANESDGYGVDRCLASGAACGAAAAAAYCQSKEFAKAASFSKVERGEITGAASSAAVGACRTGACPEFIAIVCTR